MQTGLVLKKNELEAFKQFKLAYKKSNSHKAHYNYIWMLENSRVIKIVAENGNAKAQYKYAVRLARGQGFEKNEEEAFKYFKLAAEKGHAYAKSDYEYMLKKGFGTKKNAQEVTAENEHPTTGLNPQKTHLQQMQVIKDSFVTKLNLLHSALSKQAKGDTESIVEHLSEADALHKGIKTALDSLFEKITLDPTENEIQEQFKIFRQTCSTYARKADAVMGHGWLFRAVEVLCNAISALFVGMGMAVGSIFLQGFAKESHRNWYKDAFFTPHQTEASITIKSLDQDINDLEQELKSPKNN